MALSMCLHFFFTYFWRSRYGDIQEVVGGPKNLYFCPRLGLKNVPVEVGGGQIRSKLCPRSHWMPPKFDKFLVYALSFYSPE